MFQNCIDEYVIAFDFENMKLLFKLNTELWLRTLVIACVLIFSSAQLSKPAYSLDLRDGFFTEEEPNGDIAPDKLFEQAWSVIQENNSDRTFNGQDWTRWKQHYHGKLKTHLDACVAIDTMLASLNPRSHVILPPTPGCGGWFPQGIGISLKIDEHERVVVKSIYPSRKNSGLVKLRPGDIIEAVNGIRLQRYPQSLSRVTKQIRGRPDSIVELTVVRDGKHKTFRQARSFDLKNIHGVLDNNIEYIKFNFLFGNSEVKANELAATTTRSQGTIIDFRDTSGLVSNVEGFCQSVIENKHSKPIVIITNNETTGSAIAICDELQNQKAAVLVGEQTREISKGVESTYVLEGGYFITFAMTRAHEGEAIMNNSLVVPDIEIKLSKADIQNGRGPWWFTERELPRSESNVKDLQLKRAMETLKTATGNKLPVSR